MRRNPPARRSAALASVIVAGGILLGATVAGCAAALLGGGPSTTRPASVAVSATGSPQQRAAADATAMLRAFAPPPGARRLPAAPRIAGGWLARPSTTLASTALVDQPQWWQAPGQPMALINWEQAHLPRPFRPGDSDYGPPSWDREWDLGPAPGGILARTLVVEAVSLGHGQAGLRVDAQVSWQPPRPASDAVPATATAVTLTELPSLDPRAQRPPAPVTITDPAVIRRLAALVNGLPLATTVGFSCPLGPGYSVRLTFRARPGGPPVATVAGPDPGGCGAIELTSAAGQQQPPLTSDGPFLRNVLTLAGLHWPAP